jgi:thioredoxin 1
MTLMSKDINKISEWQDLISGKQLVAADFWAPWCPYCRAFKPVFESVAQEYPNIKFVTVNVDEVPEISSRYGIQGIPVVKFFCEGKEVGEVVGYVPKDAFKKEVDRMATNAPSCLANLSSSVKTSENRVGERTRRKRG